MKKTLMSWYLAIAGAVISLDMATKMLARHYWTQEVPITPFLSLVCIKNYGVSFSFLSTYNQLLYNILTVFIGCLIVGFTYYIYRRLMIGKGTLASVLIAVGGLSNLYDRIFFGYVTDFVRLHYGAWEFYIFNFADVAITCGSLLFLYQIIRETYDDDQDLFPWWTW